MPAVNSTIRNTITAAHSHKQALLASYRAHQSI
jgi:hypothetical protein